MNTFLPATMYAYNEGYFCTDMRVRFVCGPLATCLKQAAIWWKEMQDVKHMQRKNNILDSILSSMHSGWYIGIMCTAVPLQVALYCLCVRCNSSIYREKWVLYVDQVTPSVSTLVKSSCVHSAQSSKQGVEKKGRTQRMDSSNDCVVTTQHFFYKK